MHLNDECCLPQGDQGLPGEVGAPGERGAGEPGAKVCNCFFILEIPISNTRSRSSSKLIKFFRNVAVLLQM